MKPVDDEHAKPSISSVLQASASYGPTAFSLKDIRRRVLFYTELGNLFIIAISASEKISDGALLARELQRARNAAVIVVRS